MEPSIEALKSATSEFLRRHWNEKSKCGEDLSWRTWGMQGSMPYQENQGCYALLSGDAIIYIGVGASRGRGKYEGWGLGKRVTTHTKLLKAGKLEERVYEPNAYWKEKGVTGIMTFGFPEGFGYLALALEAFLISILKPRYNVNFSDSKKEVAVAK